ncbi:MAG: hypothetical protein LC722_00180 [Actinobacteria bacterium]|nr:hypothetical protein [Actinomycetota bacterium]
MLRSKADDVLIDTDVPTQVLKRSRRRRAMTTAIAGVVGMAVLVGGFFGSRALLLTGNEPELGAGPNPPIAGEWQGLWPQDNREDAEAAQAEADAGTGFEWQTDPGQVLERYGLEIRMWDQSLVVDQPVDFSTSPINVNIGNCAQQTGETQGGGCEFALITLEQLLGTGQGKLWFVTEDVPGTPPGQSPPPPAEDVEGFAADFMDARLAESPDARSKFLTPDSEALYDTHHDGLYLYDGDVQGGQPEASYFGYEIETVTSRHDTPETWDVVVIIEAGEFEEQTDFTPEILWIGPGLRLDNTRGLVVRSAERGETYTEGGGSGEPVKHCQEGSKTPVRDCARSFMQTRLDGAGSEFYMTEDARNVYDDPDNQLHLYGTPYEDSGNFEFDRYEIVAIRKADANSYEVDVRLYVVAEGGPMTIFETLFVGPDRNHNGELQDFVVRGATGHYEG